MKRLRRSQKRIDTLRTEVRPPVEYAPYLKAIAAIDAR